MSFEKLEKPVLIKVAESFGVEVAENARPKTLIAALEKDGVTWEMAVQQVPEVAEAAPAIEEEAQQEEQAVKESSPKTLIRMDRANFSYQVRGYQFTKDAPFGLVTEDEAEWITENVEGFRYASPKEIQEFYG